MASRSRPAKKDDVQVKALLGADHKMESSSAAHAADGGGTNYVSFDVCRPMHSTTPGVTLRPGGRAPCSASAPREAAPTRTAPRRTMEEAIT